MIRIPKYQNILSVILADPYQQIYSSKRYYSALYKHLFLLRLKMVPKLIGDDKHTNLLDAGFGSGIFLPELAKRCKRLVGVDLHNQASAVKEMSIKEKIDVTLIRGNLVRLPFRDSVFDCVVSISVLEFIDDVEGALSEIKRVSKKKAKIVIGAPILNRVTGHFYDLVGFKKHRIAHKSDQNKILKVARKFFTIKRIIKFPNIFPLNSSFFFISELANK